MRLSALLRLLLFIFFSMGLLTLTACSSIDYETNIHKVNEEFNNISIRTDTADIAFVLSDDGMCRVVCYEEAKKSHSVKVQNGTLTVNVVNDKKWYDYIGINIDTPKITVYLPESKYFSLVIEESTGDIEISKDFEFKSIDISLSTGNVRCYASATEAIKIASSTGDIYAESISASSLDLTVSTGKVTVSDITCDGDITIGVSTGKAYLTDIECKNLISTGSTGDISLKKVISTEKISIGRSTGDVTLEDTDAAELFITTDTGDVEGTLLTDKVFITKTDTGRIDVPNSIMGGRCEITTDTGDIKISISNNAHYTL
ncbi:MAG: DUF4097 family beta strand repeat protein [Clostridia bacterium]|nr:DUF4097 family beta strand repeat protein [Clostridia bacterium]